MWANFAAKFPFVKFPVTVGRGWRVLWQRGSQKLSREESSILSKSILPFSYKSHTHLAPNSGAYFHFQTFFYFYIIHRKHTSCFFKEIISFFPQFNILDNCWTILMMLKILHKCFIIWIGLLNSIAPCWTIYTVCWSYTNCWNYFHHLVKQCWIVEAFFVFGE